MFTVRHGKSQIPAPRRAPHEHSSAAVQPAGIGRQVCSLLGCRPLSGGGAIPQHVQRSSQYSLAPQVIEPHETAATSLATASALEASGIDATSSREASGEGEGVAHATAKSEKTTSTTDRSSTARSSHLHAGCSINAQRRAVEAAPQTSSFSVVIHW
jgi:hypothetical protein